eukprot:CAMPEP_0167800072 /NCGR_PEP_ID=MMETSP0111_2-20121227/17497_1 /TAXON_ID=91324 /ORGANISM="Lotharella globosa, Strain CCCM811" /LENGTH=245 /DNA_ID=CAMNT_0007695229 /DNA_START=250 /DNA_END=987 /DNA_ORIENTATION=+
MKKIDEDDLPGDETLSMYGHQNKLHEALEEQAINDPDAACRDEILRNPLVSIFRRMYGDQRELCKGRPVGLSPGFSKILTDYWRKMPLYGDDAENIWLRAAQREYARLKKQKENAQLAADRRSGDTAGPDWDYLPATKIDEDYKKDYRILARRDILQPGRFYRKPDTTQFPRYFIRGRLQTGYKGRREILPLWKSLELDKKLQERLKKKRRERQEEASRYSTREMGRAGVKATRRRKVTHKRRRL